MIHAYPESLICRLGSPFIVTDRASRTGKGFHASHELIDWLHEHNMQHRLMYNDYFYFDIVFFNEPEYSYFLSCINDPLWVKLLGL